MILKRTQEWNIYGKNHSYGIVTISSWLSKSCSQFLQDLVICLFVSSLQKAPTVIWAIALFCRKVWQLFPLLTCTSPYFEFGNGSNARSDMDHHDNGMEYMGFSYFCLPLQKGVMVPLQNMAFLQSLPISFALPSMPVFLVVVLT